jgi:hypothetical protein
MTITPLGKIATVTAGTPVRATAVPTFCNAVLVAVPAGNTGKTYVGVSTLVKATFVGVIKQFLIPAATGIGDLLRIEAPDGDVLNAADLWVDSDVSGEGLLITPVVE